MQPASSALVRDREDICIYCREPLAHNSWKNEFKEHAHYRTNVCKNGHKNTLNHSRSCINDWASMIKLYLMDYPRREKLKKDK